MILKQAIKTLLAIRDHADAPPTALVVASAPVFSNDGRATYLVESIEYVGGEIRINLEPPVSVEPHLDPNAPEHCPYCGAANSLTHRCGY
jgi:hypothetical protein